MKPKLHITRLQVGQMAANCYLLTDHETQKTLIIDPGDDAEYIIDSILKQKVTPIGIVLTHGHFDHVLAAFPIQIAFGIPCMAHPADNFLLSRMQETAKHFLGLPHIDPPPRVDVALGKTSMIDVGMCRLTIREIPGHTPGSIMIHHKESESVFVGDVLFADGAVGRTDHGYSSVGDLKRSIRTILALPDRTQIYPGHGEITTVELAKSYHPVS